MIVAGHWHLRDGTVIATIQRPGWIDRCIARLTLGWRWIPTEGGRK